MDRHLRSDRRIALARIGAEINNLQRKYGLGPPYGLKGGWNQTAHDSLLAWLRRPVRAGARIGGMLALEVALFI